jgi:nitric oxide reductase NorD protein
MQPTDDELPQDLTDFAPEARKLVRDALPDAANQLPAEQLATWLEGARRLLETGVGLAPLASYLRTVPAVAKQGGEAVLVRTIATALSVATRADARATDAFLRALPLIARRLITGDVMLAFLDAADEITAVAPRVLADLFQRAGSLLEQMSVDGLRRWALLGVQGHLTDPGGQDAWFRLEGQDARAILRAASDGTLFTDVERRLGFYLRALWGRSMALRAGSAAAMHEGERKTGRRVSIIEGAIRMPPAFDAFPGQNGVTLYRAACAHAAAHLVYSTQRLQLHQLSPLQVVLVSLIEDARVEQLALRALPGLRKLWLPFHVALPSSVISPVSLMARLARALIDPDYRDDNPWVTKGRTLFAQHADSLEDPVLSRTVGMLLGQELEQMRVRFSFRTYLVEPLYRDDNRFLWDFGDAGQQQSDDGEVMHQVVDLRAAEGAEAAPIELEQRRGRSAQEQGVQTGLVSGEEQQAITEAPTRPYHYDEWDYALGMNRPSWCRLLEKRARLGEAHDIDQVLLRNQQTVDRLASLIKAAQIQRPLRLRKQLEGDKLDLDAAITATVDLRSGRTPDPRVHQRQGKTSRDLAVLLLLDLSQSTNDYVPSAGTTVLNLAREATALVADAMDKIGDSFAIHGFDSNGRHEIEYYRFKDFDEPYGERSRARLAGMTGQLSTRMGTALRHAGHFLRFRRAARKLVLLVTDGEPHDIDVHDRKYLVFDAKHAVEEQTRFGIATFCISLDAGADEYVTRIFGARNYLVLDHLRRLPEKLPLLYMRLTT